MSEKLNKTFYEPSDTTPEQRVVNEREWSNPDNWKGLFFPAYSSESDNRPFVPGRWFPSKGGEQKSKFVLGRKSIPNRAHSRGKVWFRLGWIAVSIIVIIWFILMAIYIINK